MKGVFLFLNGGKEGRRGGRGRGREEEGRERRGSEHLEIVIIIIFCYIFGGGGGGGGRMGRGEKERRREGRKYLFEQEKRLNCFLLTLFVFFMCVLFRII